jgi:hypothetical protein
MARARRLPPLLLAGAVALLLAARAGAQDDADAAGEGLAPPGRASDRGFTLQRLLVYTRRQLTSSLGGLFQMVRAGRGPLKGRTPRAHRHGTR